MIVISDKKSKYYFFTKRKSVYIVSGKDFVYAIFANNNFEFCVSCCVCYSLLIYQQPIVLIKIAERNFSPTASFKIILPLPTVTITSLPSLDAY